MINPVNNLPRNPGTEGVKEGSQSSATRDKSSPFSTLFQRVRSDKLRNEIFSSVTDSSQKYNLSPELIMAVIRQESGCNPNATSHCGAGGLMQLMPETARDLGVTNRYDVRQNIDGGCKYLRELSDRYDGNIDKTLAAYNAGPANVDKYGGIPPFEETQNYVESIKSHMNEMHASGDFQGLASQMIGQIDWNLLPDLSKSQSVSPEPTDFSQLRRRV